MVLIVGSRLSHKLSFFLPLATFFGLLYTSATSNEAFYFSRFLMISALITQVMHGIR
jgi:hypothetical protein